MNRVAVIIAAGATAALVAACGGPSSPSGDTRACQMVKHELSQQAQESFTAAEAALWARSFTTAETAASTQGLRHDIAELASAVSLEGQPLGIGEGGLISANSDVIVISATCASDGVNGISGLALDSLTFRQGEPGPAVVRGTGFSYLVRLFRPACPVRRWVVTACFWIWEKISRPSRCTWTWFTMSPIPAPLA